MPENLHPRLRDALLALAMALILCPVNAEASSSSGIDGAFHPTVSTVLDARQSIFNFTDIAIPNGIFISFSGAAYGQTIEFLATGLVDIAGALDAGANGLLIQTPGDIAFSGTLDGSGGISLLAGGRLSFSGSANVGGGSLTLAGSNLPTAGDLIINGGGNIIVNGGGGVVTTVGGTISISPAPEPETFAMLLAGLGLMGAVALRRKVRLA